jgi:hypothetical protein
MNAPGAFAIKLFTEMLKTYPYVALPFVPFL